MSEYIRRSDGPGSIGALLPGAGLWHPPTIGSSDPGRSIGDKSHGAYGIRSLNSLGNDGIFANGEGVFSGCSCGMGDWGAASRIAHGSARIPLMIGLGALAGVVGAYYMKKNKLAGVAVGVAAGLAIPTVWFDVLHLPHIVPIPDASTVVPDETEATLVQTASPEAA